MILFQSLILALLQILSSGVSTRSGDQPAELPVTKTPLGIETTDTVKLIGNRFIPRILETTTEQTVVFLQQSGGPHNVAFWPESLSVSAATTIGERLPDQIDHLMGPLLVGNEASYRISLSGMAPGNYPYFCLPHLNSGMTGTLIVKEAEPIRPLDR